MDNRGRLINCHKRKLINLNANGTGDVILVGNNKIPKIKIFGILWSY